MTGRDLIIFIMENRLEDETIFENGDIPGFMTIDQAAEKWNVWTATVKAFIELHDIQHITIGDVVYIPSDLDSPMKKGQEEEYERFYKKFDIGVTEY